jgi:Domain of unknown function (DUF4900)
MSIKVKRSEQGVAIISALLVMVIVGGILALMFSRMQFEMQHSRDDLGITQTLILARGGAVAASSLLQGSLNDEAKAIVSTKADPVARFSFGGQNAANNAALPVPADTAVALDGVATDLQIQVNNTLCNQNFSPTATTTVRVRLHFTSQACFNGASTGLPTGISLPEGRWVEGDPRAGGGAQVRQVYALPFVLVSEAVQGNYKRNIVVQGEYRLVLGRANFARFAYFSNIRTSDGNQASGSNLVWFGNNEFIDGPVHSNEYLRFGSFTSNNTRAWFGEEVTVAGCVNPSLTACGSTKNPGDYFNGSTTLRTPANINNHCATVICPEFVKGATFNASYIPLPTNNNAQRTAANTDGLFLGDFANSSNSKPTKDIQLSTRTESGVIYQIIRVETCNSTSANFLSCTPTTITEYRYAADRRLEKRILPSLVWTLDKTNFSGIVYADKEIGSLGGPIRTILTDPSTAAPSLTAFAQLTIASRGKINVTRDLKYTDPPCTGKPQRVNNVVQRATCSDSGLNATNILGIYSQGGDVLFGDGTTNKLSDLTVHGVVMSASGRVGTNNWSGSIGGTSELRLLGGVIGKNVAGFASSGGYRRVFTYDRRMLNGMAPPFFPTVELDQLQSIFVFTYGQKEQVY